RLDVHIEGTAVYDDGRLIKDFTGQQSVTEDRNLTTIGGDPTLEASVIKVNEDPELILVHAKSLSVDPGHVVLNGQPQREEYIKEPPDYSMQPFTVPPEHYWVMGDNRNDSNDSHAWGPLRGERIIGRAELIFWPINRIRMIR